ncbi:hypothetical protein NPX79_02370 [Spiroplasma endosymbiont of Anurida maritima]|uniref:hypothetical protein n=1 Tax=Spiroplasma endosymbiont of Anurida maritima TaxID=2967972 RepID=UPI0036D393BA
MKNTQSSVDQKILELAKSLDNPKAEAILKELVQLKLSYGTIEKLIRFKTDLTIAQKDVILKISQAYSQAMASEDSELELDIDSSAFNSKEENKNLSKLSNVVRTNKNIEGTNYDAILDGQELDLSEENANYEETALETSKAGVIDIYDTFARDEKEREAEKAQIKRNIQSERVVASNMNVKPNVNAKPNLLNNDDEVNTTIEVKSAEQRVQFTPKNSDTSSVIEIVNDKKYGLTEDGFEPSFDPSTGRNFYQLRRAKIHPIKK